jgi:hypothetical protein
VGLPLPELRLRLWLMGPSAVRDRAMSRELRQCSRNSHAFGNILGQFQAVKVAFAEQTQNMTCTAKLSCLQP